MIIADQIELFFDSIREAAANSGYTPAQALTRINRSRRRVAVKTRFYDVKDKVSAVGGETYFTLLDTFIDLQDARDVVTRNGFPVTIKGLAEWAGITSGNINVLSAASSYGMLNGNTFYVYPAANAGDVFEWWGAAEPPALPDVTGPDVHLNNTQAEATVLDAAETALEDLGERPGPVLQRQLAEAMLAIKRRAKPRGPRLENAPEE